jgi:hypothetical protein
MSDRKYKRLNRDIRYLPGMGPADVPEDVAYEFRTVQIDPTTYTVPVLGGVVTAEALDTYMHFQGWARVPDA